MISMKSLWIFLIATIIYDYRIICQDEEEPEYYDTELLFQETFLANRFGQFYINDLYDCTNNFQVVHQLDSSLSDAPMDSNGHIVIIAGHGCFLTTKPLTFGRGTIITIAYKIKEKSTVLNISTRSHHVYEKDFSLDTGSCWTKDMMAIEPIVNEALIFNFTTKVELKNYKSILLIVDYIKIDGPPVPQLIFKKNRTDVISVADTKMLHLRDRVMSFLIPMAVILGLGIVYYVYFYVA